MALFLREEQVQARVVHYKAEMETNAELDAITAQVVEQLRSLQQQMATKQPARTRESIEQEQIQTLQKLLARTFREDAPSLLVEQKLKDIAKRVTRLFFESELAEKVSQGQEKLKKIYHAEQALFYVLNRYGNRMRAELEAFEYVDNDIRERTIDLLDKTSNEFRVSFLSRRSPEVKKVIATLSKVLLEFFQYSFPRSIPQIAQEVIKASQAAEGDSAMGYKVKNSSFPLFRQALERRIVSRLIVYVEERLVAALQQSQDEFRDDTINFVRSPHLYGDICTVICDALYEFLCNEGFLDLPVDWRNQLDS